MKIEAILAYHQKWLPSGVLVYTGCLLMQFVSPLFVVEHLRFLISQNLFGCSEMLTCFVFLRSVTELDLGSDKRETIAGKTQRRG